MSGGLNITTTGDPFKPRGVKWLHFKGLRAILVEPPFNFLTFGHSGTQSVAPERPNVKKSKWG